MSTFGRLLLGALALGAAGPVEDFEFVSFTPPAGWLVANAEGGRQYVLTDASGVGLIKLLPPQPAAGDDARVFAELWRTQGATIIPGPTPRAAIVSDGEATVATGSSPGGPQGAGARVVLTVVIWRGRALGVVGMATGAQRGRELDAFLGTLRFVAPAPMSAAPVAPPPAPPAQAGASTGALGFDLPTGYAQERNGEVVILSPAVASERTPCVYGIAGTRPATGNLEADARTALLEGVVAGFRRLDDRHYAMRGTSADGWPYAWYRAAFEGDVGGQRQAVNAMAMVLPAGAGRVHVVWGLGSIARCLADDAAFEQLFHSLRPAGWSSDGGQALTRALLGSWRYTASAGLQQYTFRADGGYDRDLGSRATVGVTERTSATAGGGRYSVRDGLLTLAPANRPQSPDRYRVRVYDEWLGDRWRSAMAMFQPGDPPLVIPYYRVDP